jgi:hypothetical protein
MDQEYAIKHFQIAVFAASSGQLLLFTPEPPGWFLDLAPQLMLLLVFMH